MGQGKSVCPRHQNQHRGDSMNYLIRNIPEELWREAKHAAVDRGLSLRDLILTALREYLKKGETAA